MENVLSINTITQYHQQLDLDTPHPLVSVVDLKNATLQQRCRMMFGFYAIFIKDSICGLFRYGRGYYDYEAGSMLFMSPGQVFNVEAPTEVFQPDGVGLLFHPDLIAGTSLGKEIRQYSFFSYSVNEALHLADEERKIIDECISNIRTEISGNIDRHSKKLIVRNIELLLDYSMRFFDRQFTTRKPVNNNIISRFETFLDNYFNSTQAEELGMPNVAFCAENLNLSTNYLSDLVKKETGRNALDIIHHKLIEIARERMHSPELSVSEIAYQLGFRYPQHFSRFFKKITGITPNQYKKEISA